MRVHVYRYAYRGGFAGKHSSDAEKQEAGSPLLEE